MIRKTSIRLAGIIACSLTFLCLSGCWSAREMNDLEIVIGMGIDKAKEPGNISLSAQIVKSGDMRNPSPENGSSGNQAFWDVNGNGKSIFDAIREITRQSGNRLFVSHSQVLIFSKEIAAGGIDKYIDFFLRTHEMRPSTMIFISEDSAAAVLAVKPEKEKLPSMNIVKLITATDLTSQAEKINLQQFSSRMMSKTAAPVAPLIKIENSGETQHTFISGMAVFKDFKLAGILDEDESRGLLWVTGGVKSGIIHVPAPGGDGMVILEINGAKSKVTPELKGDRLLMHIEVKEEASMTEQSTPESLITAQAFELMQKQQSEVIREDILRAFTISKELHCDIFGFGELIRKKYRYAWKQMEPRWDELYPQIELVLDIKTRVRKTELITKPVFSKEEQT